MDQATALISSGPLAGKIGPVMAEMAERIAAETGHRPVYVRLCVQMPDDSVYEARGDLCADGCGQVLITPSVIPRLRSPA